MTKEEIKSSKVGLRFNEGKLRWSLVEWESVMRLQTVDDLPLLRTFLLRESMFHLCKNPSNPQALASAWSRVCKIPDGLDPDYVGLEPMVRVLMYGAEKYDDHNWKKGLSLVSLVDCAMRHFIAMEKGEELDPESGLPHKGHLMCNLMMLAYFTLTEEGREKLAALEKKETQ